MVRVMDGVREISCALALLLFTGAALAQNPQATAAHEAVSQAIPATPAATTPAAPESKPSPVAPPKISYARGQLSIEAFDVTLEDVLTKVAALIGVKIKIPPGAGSERLPMVKLGPGPAREVVASLLSGSSLNYLILASATEPEGIQDLLLMPREKKGSEPTAASAAARSPYARVPASPTMPDETPVKPETASSAQAANAGAQTDSSTTTPTQPDVPAGSQSGLSQSGLSLAALSNQSGLTTAGAMKPPGTLDQGSINQQLLQMYQQRMQMGQQVQVPPAPVAAPSIPANP